MIDRQKLHDVARAMPLSKPLIYGWHELERIYSMKLIDPKKRELAATYNFFRAVLAFGGTDHDIEVLIDEDIMAESDWEIWLAIVDEYGSIGISYLTDLT